MLSSGCGQHQRFHRWGIFFLSAVSLLSRSCSRLPEDSLTSHPARRKVFLSFHREDLQQVTGFRLMMENDHLELNISDQPTRYPVNSERSTYIQRVLRDRIAAVDVLICMIGNGTAWRDWVDWEIATAAQSHRGICGIRLKGSTGRAPPILRELGAPIAPWDASLMTAAIERAAALRS